MTQRPALFVAIILAAAAVLAALPLVLPPFYVRVGQLMIYSAGLAVAWTILGGFAGYASFGNAAFIGVGAVAAGLVE
jgi:branched-chain amino acid transport system permease protein